MTPLLLAGCWWLWEGPSAAPAAPPPSPGPAPSARGLLKKMSSSCSEEECLPFSSSAGTGCDGISVATPSTCLQCPQVPSESRRSVCPSAGLQQVYSSFSDDIWFKQPYKLNADLAASQQCLCLSSFCNADVPFSSSAAAIALKSRSTGEQADLKGLGRALQQFCTTGHGYVRAVLSCSRT